MTKRELDAHAALLQELLSSALIDGKLQIEWAKAPELIAKLASAGIGVSGYEDFGEKYVVLTGIKVRVT